MFRKRDDISLQSDTDMTENSQLTKESGRSMGAESLLQVFAACGNALEGSGQVLRVSRGSGGGHASGNAVQQRPQRLDLNGRYLLVEAGQVVDQRAQLSQRFQGEDAVRYSQSLPAAQ